MEQYKYRIGDLVWAKMKGFSPWPGRVSNPIENLKKMPSNAMHCVFFFGTNNYAWIKEPNIKPYSIFKEKFIKSNKSRAFKQAVEAIEIYIKYKGNSIETVKDIIKTEDICTISSLEQNICNENFERNSLVNLEPITVGQYQKEHIGLSEISSVLNKNEEKNENSKYEDIKQEATEQLAEVHSPENEENRSEKKAENTNMIAVRTYNVKEDSILLKQIKTESVSYEDVTDDYKCFEHEEKKDGLSIEECNVDLLFENNILPLTRCLQDNTSYNKHHRLAEEDFQPISKTMNVTQSTCKQEYHSPQKMITSECNQFQDESLTYQDSIRDEYYKLIKEKTMSHSRFMSNNEEHCSVKTEHEKEYVCYLCSKLYNNRKLFVSHLKIHNGIKKHSCNICHKNFMFKCKLSEHLLLHSDAKLNVCGVCNKSFVSKRRLTLHLVVHSNVRKYTCAVCNAAFKTMREMYMHIKRHTGDNKKYRCDTCCKVLRSKSTLSKHVLSHNHDKKCICKLCDRTFKDGRYLKKHMQKYLENTNYSCHICKATFVKEVSYLMHLKRHVTFKTQSCVVCKRSYEDKERLSVHSLTHYKSTIFTCYICEKTYGSRLQLQEHFISGSCVKKYECDICDRLFIQKGIFTRHLLRHNGIRKYVCDICHSGFYLKSCLQNHLSTHNGITFSCTICSKFFNNKNNLYRHIEALHTCLRKYNCKVCSKAFTSKSNLNRHRVKHITKRCNCDICHRSFVNKRTLSIHLLTHSEEEAYFCDLCRKSFKTKNLLSDHINRHRYYCNMCDKYLTSHIRQHMYIHTGIKKFSCDICDMTFVRKEQLIRHINITHLKR